MPSLTVGEEIAKANFSGGRATKPQAASGASKSAVGFDYYRIGLLTDSRRAELGPQRAAAGRGAAGYSFLPINRTRSTVRHE